jgi:hypothetical protein
MKRALTATDSTARHGTATLRHEKFQRVCTEAVREVPADAGFVCDTATVLGKAIKKHPVLRYITPCSLVGGKVSVEPTASSKNTKAACFWRTSSIRFHKVKPRGFCDLQLELRMLYRQSKYMLQTQGYQWHWKVPGGSFRMYIYTELQQHRKKSGIAIQAKTARNNHRNEWTRPTNSFHARKSFGN